MSKIIRKNHVKGADTVPEFNVSKIRAMSDLEAEKRAKGDPDAPIVTPEIIKGLKIKKLKKP